MNSDNDYKLKIKKELEKEQPDWALIEKLSSTVIDSKEDSLRFHVDAGHINKLGFELVGKQETALMELIKNAYDADATEVTVDFFNAEKEGGTLVIQDNGSGMDLETIKTAWMNISTDFKQENKISPKYGRVRAGRKGIGRFSVQRLGKKLVLVSSIKGESKATKVIFNWDVDYVKGVNIRDVYVSVEYLDKDTNSHGTTLEIFELREVWKDQNLKKVWNGVLLLQSPFKPTPTINNNKVFKHDPGFETVINNEASKQKRIEYSIDTMLLDHALAEITGEIDDNGNAKVRVVSKRLQLEEEHILDKKFLLTGSLFFQTKYFIYISDLMSGNTKKAGDLAYEYGGIRIYRNGFRVLPYGERSDDWLGFDRDSGRRTILAPVANTNFFGSVYLDDRNVMFEETSNREGLLENEAFQELVSFIHDSIFWAVLRVAATRNRKQTAGQKNFTSQLIQPKKPKEIIDDLKDSLINVANSKNTTPEEKIVLIEQKLDLASDEAGQYQEHEEEKKLAAIQYEEMLRILASLGISLSIFGHEIKGAIDSLNASITLQKMMLNKKGADPELIEGATSLQKASDRIFNVGKYIGQITAHNASRSLTSLHINAVIRDFMEQFNDHLKKKTINLILDLSEEYLQSIPMHESELVSVLLNFTTNSIKFIKKAKVINPKIKITTKKDNNYLLIRFEDNGTGVSDIDKNKIFDAFYTTNIGNDDLLEGVGTGLGLKIVSDIASTYGGSVQLGIPSEEYKCCFEFRVLSKGSS
ncbi:sensor histidine kinase [Acinetobacter junii]|uniref:sensor histidine kinase n=1 Tax=Acinetobacter junii TaxID=40215 RepID=UPI001250C312|nr:sensor histidine kinase [Acinetobacter junii]